MDFYNNILKLKQNNYLSDKHILKKQIIDELLNMGYTIPQKYFKLKEEDASEFVLQIIKEIDSVINNYNPKTGPFANYFIRYLHNKVRFFYYKKNEEQEKENAIYERHILFEEQPVFYDNNDNEENIFQIHNNSSNIIIKKLIYAFKKNENIQGRFFLLAISIMPFMSINSIIKICHIFRFDENETLKLCEKLNKICEKQVLETRKLEERRNYYWNRTLFLSEKLKTNSISRTAEKEKNTIFMLESNKKKHKQKCIELENKISKVPHAIMAKEFKMNLKTYNSIICNIRCFLSDLISNKNLTEIKKQQHRKRRNIQLLKDIAADKWKKSDYTLKILPKFKPYSFFSLDN